MYSFVLEGNGISHALEFIETPIFESQRKALITDDEFRSLQSDIIKNPDIGDLNCWYWGIEKS